MRISKLGGAAGACVLLAIPAAGFAATAVTPKDGKFTGKSHYKVGGKSETATVTLVVAKDKIKSAELTASRVPSDPKHSHGYACASVNDLTTTDYKSSGSIAKDGKFNYTFKAQTFSDTVTVAGRFTDAKHATGTFRDVLDSPVSKSHCDTGKTKFSVTHK